ncbi:MAG: 2-keto-4-pentenoate hydratase, partial [Catenulispora sp. 13_1_20CM_3_70_7]
MNTTAAARHDVAIAAATARLQAAQATRIGCPPVRDLLLPGGIDAAYSVQSNLIAARVAAGAKPAGRKIGLTNPAVQAQLGVDQPDFGVLLDTMRRGEDEPIDHRELLTPRIEAELAFVLGADLDRPEVTEGDVAAATDHVVAALEIVDSRIAGWDISIVDTVADNASSGLYVLGREHRSLNGLDATAITMTMTQDGTPVSTGSGADCLGDPLTAVAWLANTARRYGSALRAGDLVLSG